MAPKTLENRLARIEALLNLEPLPSNWGVTNQRINNLKNKGVPEDQCKVKLILSFGETIPEEDD